MIDVDAIGSIEMVSIPSGSFLMGSDDSSSSSQEKPAHIVHIHCFNIGKYEVTQAQWQSVMGSNPSKHLDDNYPVENVSWNDIQGFITKLNSLTGKCFRLPSEAEWEYAARAGTDSKWSWGG